ncbi:hypothetical protein T10_8650 [Trichinella papuae]|uniref:Uncharacterized protein n=1 Tax=Trichinella papuae TaxID=268474 RepID=A0A0V1N4J1_9BILA|nr:hypothetical protein T10_8650 [Trichinella papuae]
MKENNDCAMQKIVQKVLRNYFRIGAEKGFTVPSMEVATGCSCQRIDGICSCAENTFVQNNYNRRRDFNFIQSLLRKFCEMCISKQTSICDDVINTIHLLHIVWICKMKKLPSTDKMDMSIGQLSVQFIAQQRDFHALPVPVLATLIKRTRAELLITQPCHVN